MGEQLNLWGQLAHIAPQLPLMVGLSGELLNTEGDTAFINGEGTGLRINTARISDIVKRLELSDEQKEKFVGSLAARQERGETRTLASGRLKLCIGLDRIHQVLAKGMPFNAFTKHAPNPASLNATSSFPGADPVAQFSPCEPDDAYTWARIIDRSKQGLRLVTERERTPNSRVNDVALCETLKGEHFLALTRWLKQDGDDHYAGMQVTHHGQPVAVSVSNKMGTNSEWLPGLLLGNGKAIVLPYWQMTENAIIWVYGSGYFQRWRVQRVVSSTGSQLFANGSFVQI